MSIPVLRFNRPSRERSILKENMSENTALKTQTFLLSEIVCKSDDFKGKIFC